MEFFNDTMRKHFSFFFGCVYDNISLIRYDPEEDSIEDLFKCRYLLEEYSYEYRILLVIFVPLEVDAITRKILSIFLTDTESGLDIAIVKNKYMFTTSFLYSLQELPRDSCTAEPLVQSVESYKENFLGRENLCYPKE